MPTKTQIASRGLKHAARDAGILGGAAESLIELAASMPVMGGLLSGIASISHSREQLKNMEANGVAKSDVGAQVTVGVLAFGVVGSVCTLATQGASVAAVAGAGFAGSALGVLGSAWALKLKHKNPDVKMQKLIEQAQEKFPEITKDQDFFQALIDNPADLKERLEAECDSQFAAEFMEVREQLGKAHGDSAPRIKNAISPERNLEMKGKMFELRTKVVGGGTMVALGVASAFTGGIAGAVALGAMGATYATQEHYVGKAKNMQKIAAKAQEENLKDAAVEDGVENKQDHATPMPDVLHKVEAGNDLSNAENTQEAESRLTTEEEREKLTEELQTISPDDFQPKFLERANGIAKIDIQRDVTASKEAKMLVDFESKVQSSHDKVEKTADKPRAHSVEQSLDIESTRPAIKR